MKAIWLAALLAAGWSARAFAQTAITHAALQAVTATGTTAYAGGHPFTLRGVLLNDPEEMLDTAWNPDAVATTNIGGQYQVFLQAAAAGDRGGTALWMGQNYEARRMVGESYSAAAWSNELARLKVAANGRAFRKGDLVEVTARNSMSYGGKRNVNEGHLTDTNMDFEIRLVKANAGLPQATPLTLADLVAADGRAIFDAARERGGERWQGERVRIDGLRLTDASGWGQTNWAQRICWATDGAGRSFRLRMPLADLAAAPATSEWFSAVGILNQESGSPVGTNQYELFVQEIRPALEIGRSPAGGVAVSFPADYEGYVLEYSDDGLGTWTNLDAMPRKVIVVEDGGTATNRAYRLRKID